MRIVLAGVALNLTVIVANGGVPILMQPGSIGLGSGDVVLSTQRTLLGMLSDVLAIPEPFTRPTAMSIGAMFIAVGVFMRLTWTARRYVKGREQQ
jgi:hypothetical protein